MSAANILYSLITSLRDQVPKCGVGALYLSKTMNMAGFYLLLLALFILTFILNANFLAETVSKIKREY